MTKMMIAKPFVKWVGGKRQLLPHLLEMLPADLNSREYFEPFIGGGALMWVVAQEHQAKSIVISDHNAELINAYRVVRDQPVALTLALEQHRAQHSSDYYYSVRAMDREPGFEQLDSITRASRFIYLNKTGFNGLYRVNSKGQQNVPFGRYKYPRIVDPDNLRACSDVLGGTKIACTSFDTLDSSYTKDSFVYFDPPYVPLSQSSSFTSYTSAGFDLQMQQRLLASCDLLHSLGAKFMLSNSDTELVRQLWAKYNISTVLASRSVNSKASARGKIAEVVVCNY